MTFGDYFIPMSVLGLAFYLVTRTIWSNRKR
jgi:hypothetical protein